MKNSAFLTNTWVQQVLILRKMNHMQQAILYTPSETNSPGEAPGEALALAYQMLRQGSKECDNYRPVIGS